MLAHGVIRRKLMMDWGSARRVSLPMLLLRPKTKRDDDVIASRGGNLLLVDGKVIGAIGVSGGSGSQVNVVSLAGQAALK
jgi:uncharacterized protein GlcG (DUF336 family)